MNRRELVKTLADKLSVTQAEAMRFVQAWEETTTEALESDGSLMLLGFGTLSAWEQTERIGRNPKNGVAYMIRARKSALCGLQCWRPEVLEQEYGESPLSR